MLIPGVVAATLCASVGWMVISHGVRLARAAVEARRASDRALVTDCLANVDRVIDLGDRADARVAPVVWSVDDAVSA